MRRKENNLLNKEQKNIKLSRTRYTKQDVNTQCMCVQPQPCVRVVWILAMYGSGLHKIWECFAININSVGYLFVWLIVHIYFVMHWRFIWYYMLELHWNVIILVWYYMLQLLPKRTIMVRSNTLPDPKSMREFDYKDARKELMKERRKDYEDYLRTYHHDLIPLLSTPANSTPQTRRYNRRHSPSLHYPMLPHFSFDQFRDKSSEVMHWMYHSSVKRANW